MTVHASGFSVLGSCSGSVPCSLFAVLCSVLLGACDRGSPGSAPSPVIVERSRVSMGSEVRLTARMADEPRALRAFEKAFDEFDRLDRLLSVWKPGSDVLRAQRSGGTRACAGQPGHAGGAAHRQAGQRLDGRQVRRDLRRAVGPVEVRSRPGRSDSAPGGRARTVARRRLHGGGAERRARHRVSVAAGYAESIWAASAKATRSIGRPRFSAPTASATFSSRPAATSTPAGRVGIVPGARASGIRAVLSIGSLRR